MAGYDYDQLRPEPSLGTPLEADTYGLDHVYVGPNYGAPMPAKAQVGGHVPSQHSGIQPLLYAPPYPGAPFEPVSKSDSAILILTARLAQAEARIAELEARMNHVMPNLSVD